MAKKMYHGSCHCGRVKYTAKLDLTTLTQCNCSICRKKGTIHQRIPPEDFELLSGENDLTLYQFDSKEAKHLFCKNCGIHSFSHPRFDPSKITINVRTLDDYEVQTAEYKLTTFDGQNWEKAAATIRNKP